jgi:hypothetical protein
MSGWQDVALVLAGSMGPAGIAMVTIRSDRRKDRISWGRDEAARRHDTYARFLAAATTVVADWSDVALMPPESRDEERFFDERRDVHYDQLNMVAAMVRLTAVPAVAQAAEDLLHVVREAQARATELARAADRTAAAEAWGRFDERYAEARRAFISAGRSCDIQPPEDF